ncbi:MAG: hypothetical protein PUC65_14515 [Clostridiales bacterium]|nr:hypothetical protein [Clostridiales bacterium]
MITKTLELKSARHDNEKLCKINIEVNDEDYDRILAALNHSEVDTKVRFGAKLMKVAFKIPQVKAVLPEHLIDIGIRNSIKKINTQLEQVSQQYGVEPLCIEDKSM